MVMETASQLGLFQVGCDVLVWHLLEASLEKVDLLGAGLVQIQVRGVVRLYLFLIPSPASTCRRLLVLLNAILVSAERVGDGGVAGRCHLGRDIHLVHWRRHGNRGW